jgi:hypothetical protein
MRADKDYIRTVWKPSDSFCQLRARCYSGRSVFRYADPNLQQTVNQYLQRQQVPFAFRGLSAFCLPKELRHLVRMNCGLTDLDQKAAHPNIQLSRIRSNPGRYPAVPLLEEYLQDPVAFRQETGVEKELLLSAFYGKRCPEVCHPKVRAFFQERLAIIDVDADLMKDIFPTNGNFKLKKTLQFHLNQHGEQGRQDMLYEAIVAAGGKPVSVEHDGVVFEKPVDIDSIKAKLVFEVSVTPQMTEDVLRASCKARWPNLPWDSGSELCAEREQDVDHKLADRRRVRDLGQGDQVGRDQGIRPHPRHEGHHHPQDRGQALPPRIHHRHDHDGRRQGPQGQHAQCHRTQRTLQLPQPG